MPAFTPRLRDLRRRIGRNIHDIRTRRRMPLEKLARQSGLSADTIDRLELGKDEIALHHIVRLSTVLAVNEADLLQVE